MGTCFRNSHDRFCLIANYIYIYIIIYISSSSYKTLQSVQGSGLLTPDF